MLVFIWQKPESDLWWNVKGWTANPVWINGSDRSSDQPRCRCKMEIRSVKGADGKFYDVVFPKAGEFYSLKTF